MALARGWKVLLCTSIAVYLVSLDVTIVNIAFPAMLADFEGTSRASLSWVLSGYNIAFAASLLTAGRIADRVGRRRIFYTGLLVFLVGSALCGIAPTAGLLVAGRVVQAVGGALVLPASLALVLPEFPVERRSAAIGIQGAIGGLAAATGPILGSVLVEHADWRWVFFVNGPLGLAAWVFGRRLLVESKDPAAGGIPDVLGAVLGVASVGFLCLGIVQGDDWGYGDGRIVGSFAAAAVLLPAFLLRCRRSRNPVLDLSLFGHRFFAVGNASSFLFSMAFFAMIFTNVQFMTGVWGYSILSAGMAFVPGPLTAAIVAGPAGRMADRVGPRGVIAPGAALYAIGTLGLIAFAGPEPEYWALWFPMSIVMGAGIGLTISTLGSASNAYLPPNRFAMGSAFNATSRQVGAALGVALVVALLDDTFAGFERVWWFITAGGLAAGLVMVALYRRPVADVQVPIDPEVVAA